MPHFVPTLAALDFKLFAILAFGLLLLAFSVSVFYFVRIWQERRRASLLTGELSQHSSAAPQAVSNVNQRAKLDDLRQKFAQGVSKFGNFENVYRFPWYLIVGEPGGGKSEAIRHSNIGFPPGMQDELQGVGGTINMNWWFSNTAVFLDTAGRLMFEEVRPGENNEWREFLKLLARNRPDCPINGLILVIPADSLIRDSDQVLQEKATRIAQQFDTIQRTLDIRFPVFVLITKSDLLAGFREFFDDVTDAQSQQQMIGWSNPQERDAPFQPGLVSEHIDKVVQQVKKRRLSLLRDPVPRKGQEQRLDEVDALYAFPNSLALIAPRLQIYMEKIFVAGPWSPKPLFLRGIYFASSMREGAALDQELALALGMPPDQLPEGRAWEREKAYFLRDLFIEKMFKEFGLVTRATDTRQLLRRRGMILWGSGAALALVFIALSAYGYAQFRGSIKTQSQIWAAARDDWREGTWHPIVAPQVAGDTHAEYHGGDLILNAGLGAVSVVDYQKRLQEVAPKPIETSWVYRPMLGLIRLDAERQHAQRVVLDGGVVAPVLKEARRRMEFEHLEDAPDASEPNSTRLLREAQALAALVKIEAEALGHDPGVEASPAPVIEPLMQYATARPDPAGPKRQMLDDTLAETYPEKGQVAWPPNWTPLGSASLAANKPIANGVARLRSLAGESSKNQVQSVERLRAVRDNLRAFKEKEAKLAAIADGSGTIEEKAKSMDAVLVELQAVKSALDEQIRTGREQGLFAGNAVTLRAAYDRLLGGSQSQATEAFKAVKAAARPQLQNADHRLFKETDAALDEILGSVKQSVAQTFPQQELTEMASLDVFMGDAGNGQRNYEARAGRYAAAQKEATVVDQTAKMLGQGWAPLVKMRNTIDTERTELETTSKQAPPFAAICRVLLDRAAIARTAAIGNAYIEQTKTSFAFFFNPPLVSGGRPGAGLSVADMRNAQAYYNMWIRELNPQILAVLPAAQRSKLDAFLTELKKIDIPAQIAAASGGAAPTSRPEKMRVLNTLQ